MKILFINGDGGGFADYMDIEPTTTIAKFLSKAMPDRSAGDGLIRVNRQPVSSDYVLQEGDRVSVTPIKIDGAVSVR